MPEEYKEHRITRFFKSISRVVDFSPLWKKIKENRTTFISIIITLSSGIIGFYINSYLNKGNITIPESAITIRKKIMTFKRNDNNSLSSSGKLAFDDTYSLDDDKTNSSMLLLELKQLKKQYDRAKLALEKINQLPVGTDTIKKISSDRLNKNGKDNSNIDYEGDYYTTNYSTYDYYSAANASLLISDLIDEALYKKYGGNNNAKFLASRINLIKTEEDNYKRKIGTIIKNINQQMNDNPNEFYIEVLLYNRGNTQTVVKYKAELLINDININLSRYKLNQIKNYPLIYNNGNNADDGGFDDEFSDLLIIKPREFSKIYLTLDESSNYQKNMLIVKDALTRDNMASLRLFDIDDKQIKSNLFKFQFDLTGTNDDQILSKYIKDNFPEFQ